MYGVLETGLNATFPIVGLRGGMSTFMITTIISAFSVGTILFQVPIGIFSDRTGRGKVLPALILAGSAVFLMLAFVSLHWLFIGFFFVLGILLGSLYSLGLSYMTDLTPTALLPAGNILVGMCFSMGSILGPTVTGALIGHFGATSFYYAISFLLAAGALGLFFHRNKTI